jgi:cell division septal protein FtsQ
MREQVIASRGSRNPAHAGREFVQRPRRRASRAVEKRNFPIRSLVKYVSRVVKIAAVILVIGTLIIAYRAAASAALFQVRAVDVSGTSRTSPEEIEGLVRRAVARTGVWRADLEAISAELQRLPSVRRAIVSRVLPDRLRVRITERAPVGVVRTSAGHFIWVDEEGVSLGEMKSTDQMPPFFIRGWNEDSSDDETASNGARVQKYLELSREWQTAGLADRISEVNLIDLRDIRVQLAGADSQVEVRLGGQDATQRLESALEALDRYKQVTNGATITYVDSQGPRVTLGFSSGNKLKTDSSSASQTNDRSVASTLPDTAGRSGATSTQTKNIQSTGGKPQNAFAKADRAKTDRSKTQRH